MMPQPQTKLFALVAALSLLLHYVVAQQSCLNTCTGSANVLTQLKTCSGCGTDDWPCFCRCSQYTDALMSCAQQNCEGTAVEDSFVSFCSSQGVSISYSSGSTSAGSTTAFASSVSASSSVTFPTSLSNTGTAAGGESFPSSATLGSSFTATDSSAISSYLATAIPASARTESSDACFVNTPYSYYSTPTWYSTLPTQAQSYYSSVNQGNTAACTLSSAAAAAAAGSRSNHHGLSAGAIAGIVVGAILTALLLALLLWCCLRRRRRARRDPAADGARNYESRSMPPGMYSDKKGLTAGAVPTSNTRAPYENEKALAGARAAVPGQARRAPYGDSNGLVGAAPVAKRRAAQAPYENRGSNGFAAASTGGAGHQTPYSAGGIPGGSVAAPRGGALGAGGRQPDWSHTTTTTTRVTIRPRLKDAPMTSSPPPRPLAQPVQNHASTESHSSQDILSKPMGRGTF